MRLLERVPEILNSGVRFVVWIDGGFVLGGGILVVVTGRVWAVALGVGLAGGRDGKDGFGSGS